MVFQDIWAGEIGKLFEIDVGEDISDADVIQFIITKENGTVVTWDATNHPTDDNIAIFITSSESDLTAGLHTLNAWVEWTDPHRELKGHDFKFLVKA